ncbi:hypothetical protein MNBD_CHLOROFLEXI01-3956 [hydrothermal vent metagenome]|uniref:Uncharacterized protein n=1 Tax=hydrothermal vent metagenome TaxID=652676 RepID=A0A3B0UPV3_9ZZZZ
MDSLFSSLRNRGETESSTLATVAVAAAEATPAFIPHGHPSQADILTQIREALVEVLPPQVGSLPEPGLTITNVATKPTGLSNFVGEERLNQFAIVLRGGRVEAAVSFHLWAITPNDIDPQLDQLHANLLEAKDDLRAAGFLRITAAGSSLATYIPSLNAWRATSEYIFLYEFLYTDTDGAQSLIAQIPIHTDPEELNSPQRETAVVSDEMVRWDDDSAPALVLRGNQLVSQLSALTFVPGATPSGEVLLLRTYTDAIDPAAEFPNLDEFITAVTDPDTPARNAQVILPLNNFLAAFTTTGDPIELGDWNEDNVPDNYEPRLLKFAAPIPLPQTSDRLQLVYQPDSNDPQFDQVAVIYLRAGQL